MAAILLIGYGNTLRGDDALGPHIAERVQQQGWAGVRVLVCPQLLPELAEELTAPVECVVFVDAAVGQAEAVRVVALSDSADSPALSHTLSPGGLLALARGLGGPVPRAFWVTVAGENFQMGEGLSRAAERNAQRALMEIRNLICPG